jgi:adenylosuccinate lyase
MEAAKKIKLDGGENDLIPRILNDTAFNLTENEMNGILRAEQFTGRAKEQTEEFLPEVRTVLDANNGHLGAEVTITV